MSIYNRQIYPNHWNIIITRGMKMTLLFTPCQALRKYIQGHFWLLNFKRLISRKLQMLVTNGFQILNPDILKLRKNSSCTNNIHVQRDAQKHCFIYPHTTLNWLHLWKLNGKSQIESNKIWKLASEHQVDNSHWKVCPCQLSACINASLLKMDI